MFRELYWALVREGLEWLSFKLAEEKAKFSENLDNYTLVSVSARRLGSIIALIGGAIIVSRGPMNVKIHIELFKFECLTI